MRIRNWERFQHYKYRRPPWVRIYRALLEDPEWYALSGDASKLLVECWLIASENNGELPPMKTLAFRLRRTLKELEALITELDHWLEGDASTMLADREQDATPEYRVQSTEYRDKKEEKYAFEGSTIRLTHQDHNLWLKTYTALDLNAELVSRDAYLSSLPEDERKRWFVSTATYLRNRQIELRKQRPLRVAAPYKPFVPEPPDQRPPLAERMKKFEEVQALTRRMRADALVCSDDKKPERKPSAATANGSGLRHVLSTLPPVDDSQEDQAEGGNQAVSN